MRIIKDITVDTTGKNAFRAIVAKQHDNNSRYLRVTITAGEERIQLPVGATAMLNVRRDGESRAYECEVCDDGAVIAPLTGWALEAEGRVRCDISIFCGDSRLTSTFFDLEVEASSSPIRPPQETQPDVFSEFCAEISALKNKLQALENQMDAAGGGFEITLDSTLSAESTNPVQNSAITAALAQKANATDTYTRAEIDQKTAARVATQDRLGCVKAVPAGAEHTELIGIDAEGFLRGSAAPGGSGASEEKKWHLYDEITISASEEEPVTRIVWGMFPNITSEANSLLSEKATEAWISFSDNTPTYGVRVNQYFGNSRSPNVAGRSVYIHLISDSGLYRTGHATCIFNPGQWQTVCGCEGDSDPPQCDYFGYISVSAEGTRAQGLSYMSFKNGTTVKLYLR